MGPRQATLTGLAKSFTLSGRACRSEFWWFWAFHFIFPASLMVFLSPGVINPKLVELTSPVADAVLYFAIAIYALTIPGTVTAIIRRFHDIGKRGVIAAILYVAVLAFAFGVVLWEHLHDSSSGMSLPVTEQFIDDSGVNEVPELWIIMGPFALVAGIIEIIFQVMLFIAVVVAALTTMKLTLFTIGFGLARPSQAGPNQYGPNPLEVTQ